MLTWSILIYAFSALASGYATNIGWLVASVARRSSACASSSWPRPRGWPSCFPTRSARARVGYTQAFGSVGGLLVSYAYYFAVTHADSLPAIYGAHTPWRYTLISGLVPAIPLLVIRPFLPESPIWQQKKLAGTLERPSIGELFAPTYRRTTIVTTIMFACAFGAAFGAIQHMPRIVPGIPEVASMAPAARQQVVSVVQSYQEYGGLIGRIILAILAVRLVSRRALLWVFQIPGLFVVPIVFFFAADGSLDVGQVGDLLRGPLHRFAVQLLGQLSAAHVPDLSSRHG